MPPKTTNIEFGSSGALPVPKPWMIAPVLDIHFEIYKGSTMRGWYHFTDEDDMARKIHYVFKPGDNPHWKGWNAIGWEDCEVGHGFISATYWDDSLDNDVQTYDARVTWAVEMCHDGDPDLEFWGWKVHSPSVSFQYGIDKQIPLNLSPCSYVFKVQKVDGTEEEMTVSGDHWLKVHKEMQDTIDADPALVRFIQASRVFEG